MAISKARAKRVIKLQQANSQGNEFITVSPKTGTQWASCGNTNGQSSMTSAMGMTSPTFVFAYMVTPLERNMREFAKRGLELSKRKRSGASLQKALTSITSLAILGLANTMKPIGYYKPKLPCTKENF